jgi:hypothetical protein
MLFKFAKTGFLKSTDFCFDKKAHSSLYFGPTRYELFILLESNLLIQLETLIQWAINFDFLVYSILSESGGQSNLSNICLFISMNKAIDKRTKYPLLLLSVYA